MLSSDIKIGMRVDIEGRTALVVGSLSTTHQEPSSFVSSMRTVLAMNTNLTTNLKHCLLKSSTQLTVVPM
jgi:hypothetical protein